MKKKSIDTEFTTTYNKCRRMGACPEGLSKLRLAGYIDDDVIRITDIIKTNSLDNAIWALRTLPDDKRDLIAEFAIRCAKHVCNDPQWNLWAKNWLSGKDRSSAAAAYDAAYAADAAYDAAVYVARSAYAAAVSAAYAAVYVAATYAVRAVAAANAANAAAYAAADAAGAAYDAAADAAAYDAELTYQIRLFKRLFK